MDREVVEQKLESLRRCVQRKKAVGFRNMAVHNYDVINWNIVHSIATNHLADFSAFARVVATKLGN